MIAAIVAVLACSILASLLLAAVGRAARPGGLLAVVGRWWQWWLIYRPTWLPDKPTGGCTQCTATWLPGVPVAVLVACYTPAGWWALAVPLCVGVLSEILLEL